MILTVSDEGVVTTESAHAQLITEDGIHYSIVVTLAQEEPVEPTYAITIAEGITNGTVTADKETAAKGETINLTITPEDGYVLERIAVTNDADSTPVEVNGTSFTMPAADVIVTAAFVPAEPGYVITIPASLNLNDHQILTITVGNVKNLNGRQIVVNVDSDGTMENGEHAIGYTLSLERFAFEKEGSFDLALTVGDTTGKPAGTYEDTLTISFYQLPEDETPKEEPAVEPFEPMPDVDNPILSEPTLGDVVKLPYVYPTANVLHDEYLGAGGGLGKLHIVFDGDYLPQDYELLDVFIDDEEQGNGMLVCAFPDEEGKAAQRSLILSANQLVKLAQKQATEHILFENGSAIAELDMTDLLGGDLVKLMALILEGGEEITPEVLARDWSLVEPVVIPAWQLRKIDVEIRIVPAELEDGTVCYEVSVWLRWGDQELNVSGMIPSLTVAIAVDDLVTQENFETFAALYTLAHRAPDEDADDGILPEIALLPSTLLLMPDELPEHQDDTAEHFSITIPDTPGELPVTAYDADAQLVPYRHYVLAADYAGEGIYLVCEAE